jgi:hypothetical protein
MLNTAQAGHRTTKKALGSDVVVTGLKRAAPSSKGIRSEGSILRFSFLISITPGKKTVLCLVA